MKMVLLIGLGRFGRHVAEKLMELRHQVMAIDINEERVNHILPIVTNAQIGDSTDVHFMETLGVRNFDLCIVAIGDDFQSSLETTSLLKELGAPLVVSRASRDVQAKFLLRNGADEVVYPERQLATWTAIKYSSEHILNYFDLGTEYGIYEMDVPKSWIGKAVKDVDIRKKYNMNILGFRINGQLEMVVTPNTVFTGENPILILGKHQDIQKCFHL